MLVVNRAPHFRSSKLELYVPWYVLCVCRTYNNGSKESAYSSV